MPCTASVLWADTSHITVQCCNALLAHARPTMFYIPLVCNEKSQFNRLVWGSLTLAPIRTCACAIRDACTGVLPSLELKLPRFLVNMHCDKLIFSSVRVAVAVGEHICLNLCLWCVRPLQYNSLFVITRPPPLETFASQTSYLIIHVCGTRSQTILEV